MPRKKGDANEIKRRVRHIRCPVCGHRVVDAPADTKVQLIALAESRNPDLILKCGRCGAMVGVMKTE
jgi:DNA-directed RNA polymerase subunit RPC12/RpoP